MNKEIKMITLNKIKECLYRIYEAEDEDCPNRIVIAANNRAIDYDLIDYYLKDYSEEQKQELLEILDVEFLFDWHYDCVLELEKLGWKIKEE